MDQFEQRRAEFMKHIGTDIAVVSAATETVRNADTHHTFHQASNFFFLTGFAEPDAVALFDPAHDEPYVLLVRPHDPELEAWNGRRAGVDGAIADHGANAAFPIDDLARVLRGRLLGRDALWYTLGGPNDNQVLGALDGARAHHLRTGQAVPTAIRDAGALLGEMRVIKTADEIEAMRDACRISADGHAEAMRFAAPGLTEHAVQTAMEFTWRSEGAVHNGYPSIVASGDNACILHYTENDRTMEDGDLLLIDAAAEVGHMSADITRTFPVNGVFTTPQRAVYDVVLAAQEDVISACKPGLPYSDMHDIAVRTLTEGMVDLGLVPGPVEDAIGYGWYRQFYFHGTGHWLGMDVHDSGAHRVEGKGRPLEPGMIFTIEPGIYVAAEKASVELHREPYDPQAALDLAYLEGAAEAKRITGERKDAAESFTHTVPEEYLGIGVRIEDDVLVTKGGIENLSRGVPVDPDEIEVLAGEGSVVAKGS
jgi:Xaa-Pro aminopeptidase